MSVARRVRCTFYPNALMSVFHAPEVEIDGGLTNDPVDVACKFYLLWQLDYSEAGGVLLEIEGQPAMSAIVGRSLFGRVSVTKTPGEPS